MRQGSLLRVVAAVLLLCSFTFAKGTHSGSSHSSKSYSSKPHKVKASSAEKTVHVRGYRRKDGTYVSAHDRRAPDTAGVATTSSGGHRRNYVADGFTADSTVQRDKHGRIKRSKAAKSAFEREHPCPSTGKSSGRCPGYIVDHVKPLECGGPDAPSNMQWQTTADAKAKDRTEGSCRI
jgi:hypothetical protein